MGSGFNPESKFYPRHLEPYLLNLLLNHLQILPAGLFHFLVIKEKGGMQGGDDEHFFGKFGTAERIEIVEAAAQSKQGLF